MLEPWFRHITLEKKTAYYINVKAFW
jgi:hypothetical protein